MWRGLGWRHEFLTLAPARSKDFAKQKIALPIFKRVQANMTKTQSVEFRGDWFWSYDVVSGVLLKHMVDEAEKIVTRPENYWLADCIEHWRVGAVVADLGIHFDDKWTNGQLAIVIDIIENASRSIQLRESLPAEEIESWELHDELRICARGHAFIPTKSVTALAQGMIALLRGELPPRPNKARWYYTIDEYPGVIPMLE